MRKADPSLRLRMDTVCPVESRREDGIGSDLLGPQHVRQSTEFTLRAQVLPAIDVLRSACTVNAELMGRTGRLGCIRKGAAADLLVIANAVDGGD